MTQWQCVVLKTQMLKFRTSTQNLWGLIDRSWLCASGNPFLLPWQWIMKAWHIYIYIYIYIYMSVQNYIIEHMILLFSHKVIIPLGWRVTLAPPHDWKSIISLTFRGLCIVIYSYNRSQWDALFQICFGKELYMFRTDLLSIIRSYACHARYVDCLLADSQHNSMTNNYCCV